MRQIVDLVAGARPNFVKLAPVVSALTTHARVDPRIVHTGQHYSPDMNEVFFSDLGIPAPACHLEVGSGTHGAQTARIIERYEAQLFQSRPAATVVFGDVNSTAACALAAVKLGVPVIHVEAGLRSFDRTMPEEINRIVTDAVADLLLVSEPSGIENLRHEGIADEKVRLVGNVMIDSLAGQLARARQSDVLQRFGLTSRSYGLITMHRPSNVDEPCTLRRLLGLFGELSKRLRLVFPVHPRTRVAAEQAGLSSLLQGEKELRAIGPLSYHDNLGLMAEAKVVLTDSGGMQEETTILGVPCLTLRDNTERPITVAQGTSRLVGNDEPRIRAAFDDALGGRWPAGQEIPLWDGHAGERIASAIEEWLSSRVPAA